jgi:hypothetical protein
MKDVFKPDSRLETAREMETRITALWEQRGAMRNITREKVEKLEAREAALRQRIRALGA